MCVRVQTGMYTFDNSSESMDWVRATVKHTNIEEFSLTSENLVLGLLRIVLVLVGVAYFTLAERKVMAAIQRRRGPNVVGIFGLLQPLADGLKLLCKEMIVPSKSSSLIFLIAPIFILIMSLVG